MSSGGAVIRLSVPQQESEAPNSERTGVGHSIVLSYTIFLKESGGTSNLEIHGNIWMDVPRLVIAGPLVKVAHPSY